MLATYTPPPAGAFGSNAFVVGRPAVANPLKQAPRQTETSPFIELVRATRRLRSSGSCARTGVKLPATESIAPVKARNRKLPKRLMPESPAPRSHLCTVMAKWISFMIETHTVDSESARWPKTTTHGCDEAGAFTAPG